MTVKIICKTRTVARLVCFAVLPKEKGDIGKTTAYEYILAL